jgi:hypothetical protein
VKSWRARTRYATPRLRNPTQLWVPGRYRKANPRSVIRRPARLPTSVDPETARRQLLASGGLTQAAERVRAARPAVDREHAGGDLHGTLYGEGALLLGEVWISHLSSRPRPRSGDARLSESSRHPGQPVQIPGRRGEGVRRPRRRLVRRAAIGGICSSV